MPSSTYGRYSNGTLLSSHQTIFFFGGESFADGFAFSSRQRLMRRRKIVSVFFEPKSFVALRKWPTRWSA